MAPGKPAVEFNAIINADRKRRKNEALAQEIFSKNRRSSAPGAGITSRKPGAGASLASRIGVTKRTVSSAAKLQKAAKPNVRPTAGDVDAEWTHDLHSLNNPSAGRTSQLGHAGSKAPRSLRNERLHNALHGSASSPALSSQFNIVTPQKPQSQMSIRGLAGPYVVMAKNFVLGTTVADIESAVTSVGGVTLNCRIIAERPNVIAEIIFESKEGADNVVATFNNQNADGNILHVYHKIGGSIPKLPVAQAATPGRSTPPAGPRADTRSDRHAPQARRRDRDSRDDLMDGSYGFDDHMDTDDQNNSQGRLYSDSMVGNRSRGPSNGRDTGRGNNRGRGHR